MDKQSLREEFRRKSEALENAVINYRNEAHTVADLEADLARAKTRLSTFAAEIVEARQLMDGEFPELSRHRFSVGDYTGSNMVRIGVDVDEEL